MKIEPQAEREKQAETVILQEMSSKIGRLAQRLQLSARCGHGDNVCDQLAKAFVLESSLLVIHCDRFNRKWHP
jgi:hypothetical protein